MPPEEVEQLSRFKSLTTKLRQLLHSATKAPRNILKVTLAQNQYSAKSEIFVFPETSDEFSRSQLFNDECVLS